MVQRSLSTGIQQALTAGIFASCSSVFGKLMTQSSNFAPVWRGVFLIANLVCTVLMIGMYTRSMRHLSTTAATIVNSCANFLFTAVFGHFLFGERLGIQWSMGTILMSIGIAVILSGEKEATTTTTTSSHAEQQPATTVNTNKDTAETTVESAETKKNQ